VLLELAARIAERPVLVTFNGKTFDWPLLESRYLMTRCIRVPELGAHLDLLHPARAVWKLRLGSVRLVELERHVLDAVRLGWDRQDDVPSSMIRNFILTICAEGRRYHCPEWYAQRNGFAWTGSPVWKAQFPAGLQAWPGYRRAGLVWTFTVFAPPRGARQSGINLCGGARSWPASSF